MKRFLAWPWSENLLRQERKMPHFWWKKGVNDVWRHNLRVSRKGRLMRDVMSCELVEKMSPLTWMCEWWKKSFDDVLRHEFAIGVLVEKGR
jgi:hypothetical protein